MGYIIDFDDITDLPNEHSEYESDFMERYMSLVDTYENYLQDDRKIIENLKEALECVNKDNRHILQLIKDIKAHIIQISKRNNNDSDE